MVVDGLKRKPLVTKGLQSLLDAFGVKVGQSVDPGDRRHAAGSVGGKIRHAFRLPLWRSGLPGTP